MEVIQVSEFDRHWIVAVGLHHRGTRTHRTEHRIIGVEIDQPGPAVGQVRAIARVADPTPAEVAEDEDSRRHTVATS
jgi:hypothetical protein